MTTDRSVPPASWTDTMRQDWEDRAKSNPRFFICTDVRDDEQEFLESGRADFDRHVRPFLAAHRFAPSGKVALEIGCGIGRMTWCFAEEFAEVIGLDISETMIEQARGLRLSRASFVLGSGRNLAGVPDRSVDFAFSFIVFQHIPEKEIILRYMEETARVLRPGGLFRFHLNGLPHAELGNVLLEGYVSDSPRLRRFGLKRLPFIRRRHLDTWLGHPVSVGELMKVFRCNGLELLDVTGRWSPEMWVSGRKRADV
jgi:SAM-dependent methyltransferase